MSTITTDQADTLLAAAEDEYLRLMDDGVRSDWFADRIGLLQTEIHLAAGASFEMTADLTDLADAVDFTTPEDWKR